MALTKDPATKTDTYAWLGLAILNFSSAPSDLRKVQHSCWMPACMVLMQVCSLMARSTSSRAVRPGSSPPAISC